MNAVINDPIELLIAEALDAASISYVTDAGGGNPSGLDFKITDPVGNGIEIEVKRFHSPRIAEQMSRADNVIAIQGSRACAFFVVLLEVYARAQAIAMETRRAETGNTDSVAKP